MKLSSKLICEIKLYLLFYLQNNSKMSENESMYGTTLSQESIKVIAESIGVGNFPDEAAKDLAEDVSYRLKEIIQVSK